MGAHTLLEDLATTLEADARLAAAIRFGSSVCAAPRADSDVDVALLYVDDEARRAADVDLLSLLGRLGIVAQRDVHLIDLERVDPELRRSIFARGRTLFDRSEGRLQRLLETTLREYFDWEYARTVIDAAQARRLSTDHGRP